MGITVDQTLHGYSNGHTLLQSSARLSNDAARLMLSLSDMSGPGMRKGFETYLTAYSLPSEQTYVIARTWYASEMQRPGCVWTRSLLIRNGDVGRIRNALSLTGLFRRPASPTETEFYAAQLTVEDNRAESRDDSPVPPTLSDETSLRAMLWLLYVVPDKPVYLVARTARDYEPLVLKVWSQQWPRLRTAFSFCTGALANRTVKGRSLDLQVVPREVSSEFRDELARGSTIDPASSPAEGRDDVGWISVAVADILSDSDLRTTAWDLAAGVAADRASFPAVFYLASVMERHRASQLTPHQYVRALVSIPSDIKTPASLLKKVLGAPESSPAGSGISDRDLLQALTSLGSAHLSAADLNVAARAQRLWKTDRDAALELFLDFAGRESTTEVGDEILVGISRALEIEDLDGIAHKWPAILNVIIKQRPQLAASPAVWRADQNSQAEMFHALMATELDRTVLRDIVGAILLSSSEVVPEHAFQYGDRLIVPVLEWLNANGSESLKVTTSWSRYLRFHKNTVAWLRGNCPDPALLVLLASSLRADASAVNALNLRTWLPLLKQFRALADRDALAVGAFLFAIGLRHCEALAMEFVRDCFETVHDAAARGDLDDEYWQPIESVAPALTSWRGWDKCERIRVALLDRFVGCEWANAEFLEAVKSTSTLEQFFGLSNTTKSRRRFLRRTAQIALQLPLTAERRTVIQGCL